MKRLTVIILLVLAAVPVLAQDVSRQKEQKKQIEQEIALIDKQLDANTSKRKKSLNTLILTRRKLEARKKLIAQLEITSKDGSRQVVTSGAGWKATANGPIVANNEYDGEEYDARKEMPGWSETGFDDSQWLEAELVSPPKGELGAQLNKNITVMDSIAPVGLWKLKEGTYILDMGQNMVGWLRMKVKGEQGTQVSLHFAEFLNEDGTINQENLRGGLANDKYTLKGKGTEVWEPSFTSHGFRYVEITGYPGEPHKDDFEGRIVYDEMRRTGSFEMFGQFVEQNIPKCVLEYTRKLSGHAHRLSATHRKNGMDRRPCHWLVWRKLCV